MDLPLDHVHVAPDEPSDAGVVVCHGRGADERDLLPVVRDLPLHVVSLRAPERLGPGFTWYDLDVPDGDLHASQPGDGFRASLDAVAESADRAGDDLALDAVGLLGFSQGAILSLSLLLERPERYAWAAALHGYLADAHADRSPEGLAGKPVFVGAGRADRVIPADRAERAAERLREVGADVEFGVYDAGHGIGPAEREDLVAFVRRRIGGE